MIKGKMLKNGKVYEVYRGSGLVELIPEVVEPDENAPRTIDALFYFMPKKQKPSVWRNVAICSITVAPLFAVSLLSGYIENDNLFTGLFCAVISWVGLIIYANIRKGGKHDAN